MVPRAYDHGTLCTRWRGPGVRRDRDVSRDEACSASPIQFWSDWDSNIIYRVLMACRRRLRLIPSDTVGTAAHAGIRPGPGILGRYYLFARKGRAQLDAGKRLHAIFPRVLQAQQEIYGTVRIGRGRNCLGLRVAKNEVPGRRVQKFVKVQSVYFGELSYRGASQVALLFWLCLGSYSVQTRRSRRSGQRTHRTPPFKPWAECTSQNARDRCSPHLHHRLCVPPHTVRHQLLRPLSQNTDTRGPPQSVTTFRTGPRQQTNMT
ncbi:hypothetical protein C8Q76DRAFT_92837 [Earliella scabrosa]|nr:hypothetical protein C8Q76DRAFT_92837 [Earliella scabrosa]